MAILITIPRLGWSMDEGTFGEWLFADGERVLPGDLLFVLEGDKSSQDIESFDEGVLHIPANAPQPGDKVVVGQPIGFLLAEGEEAPALPATPPTTGQGQQQGFSTSKRPAGPAARRLAREQGIDLNEVQTQDPTGRVTPFDLKVSSFTHSAERSSGSKRQSASPRARQTAKSLGVELGSIQGTGKNGRIRERDVLAASHQNAFVTQPVASGKWLEPNKLRRTIANRLSQSHTQCVPVTLHAKANAAHLVKVREILKLQTPKNAPSFNDILLHYVSLTLKKNPILNCCWINDKIYQFDDINIAFAVDTDAGLLAPVLEQTDSLTIEEITNNSRELIHQAHQGKLSETELSLGTFTVSNLGMLGVDQFTPVINYPQCAILGVGKIANEPIVLENELRVGHTISLSLTFDHRAVDGAPAAKWLQQLCFCIEGRKTE